MCPVVTSGPALTYMPSSGILTSNIICCKLALTMYLCTQELYLDLRHYLLVTSSYLHVCAYELHMDLQYHWARTNNLPMCLGLGISLGAAPSKWYTGLAAAGVCASSHCHGHSAKSSNIILNSIFYSTLQSLVLCTRLKPSRGISLSAPLGGGRFILSSD